ncbi:MAG: hypothetical protein RR190_00675 [Bacteroidales bacterium]
MFDLKNLENKGEANAQKQEQKALLSECATMLENYVDQNLLKKNETSLNNEDLQKWQNQYYPEIVEKLGVLDNLFFDPSGKDKTIGIGTNGLFTPCELFHFLYRLYKTQSDSNTSGGLKNLFSAKN